MNNPGNGNISFPIKLNKLYNTRDLGGIRTRDGEEIRKGMLIRSGQLYFADESDIAALGKYNISRIYDFRSAEERLEKPDPVIGRAQNIHVPILRDLTAGITREKKADAKALDIVFESARDDPEFGFRYMIDTYQNLVKDDYSVSQYSFFIRDLASLEDGAALWHCTAGKDRAGFASVLMLEILGVDRKDIFEDYLATNVYLEPELEQVLAFLDKQIGIKGHEDVIRKFFGAREEYLAGVYKYVDDNYGGMAGFIRNALGIDDGLIQKMKQRFLA